MEELALQYHMSQDMVSLNLTAQTELDLRLKKRTKE